LPPLPSINYVYQVTLDFGTSAGVTPRNVLHVNAASFSPTEQQVATAVRTAIAVNCFNALQMSYSCAEMKVIKLDGSSPTQICGVTGFSGSASGDEHLAECAVVSLRGAFRGPAHRGRIYIGPVGDGAMSSGQLVGGTASACQTAWNTFLTNLVGGTPSLSLVVLSRKHGYFTTVTNCSVSTIIGTQRRRNNQLRP